MKTFFILLLLCQFTQVFAQVDSEEDFTPETVGEVDRPEDARTVGVGCPGPRMSDQFKNYDIVSDFIASASNTLEDEKPSKRKKGIEFKNKKFPNDCDPNARGTSYQYIRYGLVMARGYHCRGLKSRNYLNYGCFCGSSNTGLNTVPADKIDKACMRHDHNLWAICQNPKYNVFRELRSKDDKGKPCNCYENTPMPKCANGEIVMPKGLTPCEKVCLKDVIDLTGETKADKKDYKKKHHHPLTQFTGLEMPELDYCRDITPELPENQFGKIIPEPETMRGKGGDVAI